VRSILALFTFAYGKTLSYNNRVERGIKVMVNPLFSLFGHHTHPQEEGLSLALFKEGDSGDAIRVIQQRLGTVGFPCGTPDGDYGPKTAQAVAQFQQSIHLPPTGEVDHQTLQALGYEADQQPLPPASSSEMQQDFSVAHVSRMFPGAPLQNIRTYLPLILNAMVEFGMADAAMILVALATIRAETGLFAPIDEGQSSYNTAPGGAPFARYDFRQDLGNNAAGDGARYKGRGFIQLTGCNNYQNYSHKLGLGDQLVREPERANDPTIAARVLAAFLKDKEALIRKALNQNDFAAARRAVNGGTNGLDTFIATYRSGAQEIGLA
jgi:putative chitinase